MQQSTSIHVGIIMDGNGRWATAQGSTRAAGHRAGAAMVRRIVEAAPDLGIGVLTLYAFSADNWRRPKAEVGWLMRLFREYLRVETARCVANGVRLEVVGRRDRIGPALRRRSSRRSARPPAGRSCSSGSRSTTPRATPSSGPRSVSGPRPCRRARRSPGCSRSSTTARPVPEVDLLIRTGGERRLSDFLLWEAAYAELLFVPQMWPEFGPEALRRAVQDFGARERRFGALPDAAAG